MSPRSSAKDEQKEELEESNDRPEPNRDELVEEAELAPVDVILMDDRLGTAVASYDAVSEAVLPDDLDVLHCGQCRRLAPADPDRNGWVNCPRCSRQPSLELGVRS